MEVFCLCGGWKGKQEVMSSFFSMILLTFFEVLTDEITILSWILFLF